MRNVSTLELQAGSLSVTPSTHPNEMNFKGILVRLDEPSTKPPNGAHGHRIIVTSEVARDRLKTIVGMGLNYSTSLDQHAQRRKVGVIKKAWIEGNSLVVAGVIWKHDFPEAKQDLKKPGLGMSMELGKVKITDFNASVWKLADFYFLGATILKKDAAAYYHTEAIAAKADERSNHVTKDKKKKAVAATKEELTPDKIATIAAAAAAKAVSDTLGPTIGRQTKILAGLSASFSKLDEKISAAVEEEELEEEVLAKGKTAKDEDDEDDDEEDDDEEASAVKAAKKKAEDDGDDEDEADEEDDVEGEGVDKGDLEEMGEDSDDDDDDPGHINKEAKNKGNKTTSENALGPNVNKGVTGSGLKLALKKIAALSARVGQLEATNVSLKKQLKAQKELAVKASAEIGRKSVGADVLMLLKKNGIDPEDLHASGQKLTVPEVDALLADVKGLDITARMELKNKMLQAGFMEQGFMQRGAGR